MVLHFISHGLALIIQNLAVAVLRLVSQMLSRAVSADTVSGYRQGKSEARPNSSCRGPSEPNLKLSNFINILQDKHAVKYARYIEYDSVPAGPVHIGTYL